MNICLLFVMVEPLYPAAGEAQLSHTPCHPAPKTKQKDGGSEPCGVAGKGQSQIGPSERYLWGTAVGVGVGRSRGSEEAVEGTEQSWEPDSQDLAPCWLPSDLFT